MTDASEANRTPKRKRRIFRRAVLLVGLVLLAALLLAWFERYRIAENILADQLGGRGIEASYRIERIDPARQVLADIVIGDPASPDLTIERLEIHITPRFGLPAIDDVLLVRPRLYGTYMDGELSFGALDPLIFGEGEGPFEFPNMTLAIEDGRGLVETDLGPVGLKVAGEGHLRGGFAAELAAIAPELAFGGCEIGGATLYGTLGIDAERPGFSGPLRFASIACPQTDIVLADGAMQMEMRADRTLEGIDGQADLRMGVSAIAGARIAALAGETDFTLRDEALTARYEVEGRDLTTGQLNAAMLGLEGLLRTRRGFERVELDGELSGRGISPGPAVDAGLADALSASSGIPLEPLLARFRRQLTSESRGSTLAAEFTLRRENGQLGLVVPRASLRGRSGATLLSLSRGQVALEAENAPGFSGNFATGGEGLPRISGRIEQSGASGAQLRLRMAEYSAGAARLAVPALSLSKSRDGSVVIDGRLLASGPLPGGRARNLALPLSGNWSSAAGLSLWRDCMNVRFDAVEVSNLAFGRQEIPLCPPGGSAIVRYDDAGLRIAAGAPSLAVAGRLGQTPISIASEPVGIAWPGALSARDLEVVLGPPGTATRFLVTDLRAELGREIGGDFAGADVFLPAVPLDVLQAAGTWRYADGRLLLSDGEFVLEDRQEADRFHPLVARDAELVLANNMILAETALREPDTDVLLTQVAIRHDLATGTGSADLAVPGIDFGPRLQPVDLTRLALGVVANVEGTVTGSGRIDWDAQSLTSSGEFSSDSLDFAAAFGPVQGASGTVVFTDLLGLTTAPRQRIEVTAVNPGIEVYDGEVAVQLRGGEFLELQEASWPFLGGTLTMRPLTIAVGVGEERSYILDIDGIEASRFIERMELNNLSATGTFDGTVPVIFDADGNGRLEGGVLSSRPPGGNLAYVGELTYADLTPMADFAFDALRSLDYRQIRITMDGPLTGELATRVNVEGVSQSAEIEQNFITRRLARLPLRLVVNLRAPFYQLISSVRSMYDVSAVRDPRDLGLLSEQGRVLQRQTDQEAVDELDAAREEAEQDAAEEEAGIQPSESENLP